MHRLHRCAAAAARLAPGRRALRLLSRQRARKPSIQFKGARNSGAALARDEEDVAQQAFYAPPAAGDEKVEADERFASRGAEAAAEAFDYARGVPWVPALADASGAAWWQPGGGSWPSPMPMYRLLDPEAPGLLAAGASRADAAAAADPATAVAIYETMVRVQALDDVFYNAQRQGRISFYLQAAGEEAATVAAAAALAPDDELFLQYREQGACLWRGLTLGAVADQCTGNADSPDKGRTMPVHYGSRALKIHTISSPLATQLPQAVGAALAVKGTGNVAACFFGDGSASEGDAGSGAGTRGVGEHICRPSTSVEECIQLPLDARRGLSSDAGRGIHPAKYPRRPPRNDARRNKLDARRGLSSDARRVNLKPQAHAALNFSATLEVPVLWLCRNNGYAISTPNEEQFRGDGVAPRALALGIDAVRVDGNDALAVAAAVRDARARCVARQKPCFVELMTYRLSSHSTSDDASKYRAADELNALSVRARHPVPRLRHYLEQEGLWDDERETAARADARAAVRAALDAAEAKPRPEASTLFDDVYADVPPALAKQRAELDAHVAARSA